MNLETICSELKPRKIVADSFNQIYPSQDDYNVCDYVCDILPYLSKNPIRNRIISRGRAIEQSLILFESFSSDNYRTVLDIINNTGYVTHNNDYTEAVIVKYTKTNGNISKTGSVLHYQLPKITHDVDSVFLGHEHCHATKDTNYMEFQRALILDEVIPIFFELMGYENDRLRKKTLFRRLLALNYNKDVYALAASYFEHNSICRYYYSINNVPTYEQNELYKFAKTEHGLYLSNFYYALILYNIYRMEPTKILRMISDVLQHKSTTYEMLTKLNIYCDIKGDVFEQEIATMKRVLSLQR